MYFSQRFRFRNVYTGRINQYSYKDTLEKCLRQSLTLFYGRSKSWMFQQDGVIARTAHSIQDWFNEKVYKVIRWCARSPGLNPFEHRWSWLDGKLSKYNITYIENRKQQLSENWAETPKDYCMKIS